MPGTLHFRGQRRVDHVTISAIVYDPESIDEHVDLSVEDCREFLESGKTCWVNLTGLHATKTIRSLGELFSLHPLELEDIVNVFNRSKLDTYDNNLFIVSKMLSLSDEDDSIELEHVSLVIGSSFVLTFQEYDEDVFDPIRERLRAGKGKIRRGGADYLAYALLDAVVDNYFVVLDEINDQIEELETMIIEQPTREALERVYHMRRELLRFRKAVWPLREVISFLTRTESEFLSESNQVFYKDVYDHILQIGEAIDANREILSSLIDVYLSSVSNQTNEVMKVLTIMAAIFIPITFIAGVYGMNFEHIPELHWDYGYYFVWGLMITVVIGLLVFFRRKGWI